jgi:hypothetical protein
VVAAVCLATWGLCKALHSRKLSGSVLIRARSAVMARLQPSVDNLLPGRALPR